jgi:hypothetical protein
VTDLLLHKPKRVAPTLRVMTHRSPWTRFAALAAGVGSREMPKRARGLSRP